MSSFFVINDEPYRHCLKVINNWLKPMGLVLKYSIERIYYPTIRLEHVIYLDYLPISY